MCSLVPLRKAAYVWYRTMTAILLRRERGRNNAEMYAVLVVTPPPPPPPPPLQREVTFQKGGRNDARVRYLICILEQSIDPSFIIITSLIHMEAHWTLLLRTWLVERSLLGQLLFLLAQKTHTEQTELRKKECHIQCLIIIQCLR